MTFGERVRNLRHGIGITQEQLAARLNLSKANVSKYESNAIEPNLDTLLALSKIFNVSIDYLLGNDNMSGKTGTASSYASPQISKDVAAIINYYNKLSGNGKEKALEYIEMLKDREERKGNNND